MKDLFKNSLVECTTNRKLERYNLLKDICSHILFISTSSDFYIEYVGSEKEMLERYEILNKHLYVTIYTLLEAKSEGIIR